MNRLPEIMSAIQMTLQTFLLLAVVIEKLVSLYGTLRNHFDQ